MEQTEAVTAPQTFIVKTISGLEEVLAAELAELGGDNIQILKRAVSFEGDKRLLYKANYCLRTAQRILVPIFSFQMADEDDLYNQINAYPWENHLSLLKTLAVDAVASDSELTHTHYIALLTKDAIVDRFRTLNNGRRPNVDTENPHVRINMHIRGSICDVSIDSSGASLHKRGYRVSNAEAPMSEVLAAGLIMLSGWQRDCNFIDPMCGSGTLVIEAAMYANNFPAGMYRKEFGFMHWPDFDESLWNEVTKEALDQQTEFEHQIIGGDISAKNLASARANLKSARLHKDVKLLITPFSELKRPQGNPGIIIINPPYGERIRLNDIIGLYKSIGNTLKQEFSGYQAWVISSDQKALSFIGLRPSAKIPVYNGQLDCRFEHFDLYKGSKRGRYIDGEFRADSSESGSDRAADYKDSPSWRSKEAPEMLEESDDFKTRDFKPREKREPGDSESRPPRRNSDSAKSEFRSGDFKPREFKPRRENDDTGNDGTGKPAGNFSDGNADKPFRDDRNRREERPERRKVEKIKLKPATRIEDRNEYLRVKPVENDIDGEYQESEKQVVIPVPAAEATNQREPSRGNKFTEQRDYKITRNRELRPRKPKPEETEPAEPKAKTVAVKPKPGTSRPGINYDDLED